MTALFIAVALGAALFALPGGKRGGTDRRIAQLVSFLAVAGALAFAKLGILGLILTAVGVGLFLIGWNKDRLTDEDFQDLSEEQARRRSASGGRGAGGGSAANRGSMDRAEALSVLGLSGTPDEEAIHQAHRRMIARAHPDAGGSDYLAAKINQARDLLSQK